MAALLVCAGAGAFTGCNKDDDSEDIETSLIITPNVAVTAFSLKANDSIAPDLDSVFFSIDLEHGAIYNADSLPKGSAIDKLVPKISYSSFVSKAWITMEGGRTRTGTVNYITNPDDSIDFTGSVKLVLATEDSTLSKEYMLKVNVHQMVPDSLMWTELAVTGLPSRLPSPRAQKTVALSDRTFSFIEESDGTYTYASCSDLFDNEWTKSQASMPFTPVVRSLSAAGSRLYMLSTDGSLYESADGASWSDTGEDWNCIIGPYTDTVLGLQTTSAGLTYAQYPLKDLKVTAIDEDFPVSGFSNFITLVNNWTTSPVGFFIGGLKADGKPVSATWAFDGANWVTLTTGGIPEASGASLIPYYAFRQNSLKDDEYNVWMMVGGTLADGSFNRNVYITYDNGVTWKVGTSLMQLPPDFPAMTECDNIVATHRQSSNLSDAWKPVMTKNRPRRIHTEVDGDILYWDCPYIYLIGGTGTDGRLCNTIWRGALARFIGTPII